MKSNIIVIEFLLTLFIISSTSFSQQLPDLDLTVSETNNKIHLSWDTDIEADRIPIKTAFDYSYIKFHFRSIKDERVNKKFIGKSFKEQFENQPLSISTSSDVAKFMKNSLNKQLKRDKVGKYGDKDDTLFIDLTIRDLEVIERSTYSTKMIAHFQISKRDGTLLFEKIVSVRDEIWGRTLYTLQYSKAISNVMFRFYNFIFSDRRIKDIVDKDIDAKQNKREYEESRYSRKSRPKELFSIGFDGGVSISNIYGSFVTDMSDEDNYKSDPVSCRITPNFEFSFNWYFHKILSLKTGICYFNKGAKVLLETESDSYNTGFFESVDISQSLYEQYHISFFEVPLMLNLKAPISNGKRSFNFFGGLSFGLISSGYFKYYLRTAETTNEMFTSSTSYDNDLLESIDLFEKREYSDSLGHIFIYEYDDYYKRTDVSVIFGISYERRVKSAGLFFSIVHLRGLTNFLNYNEQAVLNIVNYNSETQLKSVEGDIDYPTIKFKTTNFKLGLKIYF